MIVDLLPTEDQQAIRDSVASLVNAEFPVSRLHDARLTKGQAEAARWQMFADLGLFGMGVAEERGGVGFGLPEEVTAARELGRGLVSLTVIATIAGAHIATGSLFEDIRDGRTKVALANPMTLFEATSGSLDVQLIDAGDASHVLLWNDNIGAIYAKPAETSEKESLDDAVRIERATLDIAQPLAVVQGPSTARLCGLMLAAYLSAVSEEAMALAVEYAKVREQFGQPIGSFQAIKHYCAEMARRSEGAISQTYFATLDAIERQDSDMFEVAAARLLANDAATVNARFGIQIHGGMGFTYEADAHFYLKRALLGSKIASGQRVEQARIINSAGPQ